MLLLCCVLTLLRPCAAPSLESGVRPKGSERAQLPHSKRGFRVAVHRVGPQAEPLARALRTAGIPAEFVSDQEVSDPARLDRSRFDALLLPDAAMCPLAARRSLLRFIKEGGDLLVIGGPLWETSRARAVAAYRAALQKAEGAHPLADLGAPDAQRWSRSSNNMASQTHWTVEPTSAPGGKPVLRVDIIDLTGWDNLSRDVTGLPGPADDVVTFWARGDAHTSAMTVELQEKDGSRWIAPVSLTPEWKRYALAAEDFGYWQDSPSKGRGGPGDRLEIGRAARLSIGIAQSHVPVGNGPHTFWISTIASGPLPSGAEKPDFTVPVLETLTPFYKTYRLPSLHPRAADLQGPANTGNQTGPIVCPIPRPRGLAFSQARSRWIPIEEIRNDQGNWRGTRVSLYVDATYPEHGSVFGEVAGADLAEQLQRDVVGLARRMADGLFLLNGGPESFSYFPTAEIPVGAVVANLSGQERELSLGMRVSGAGERQATQLPTLKLQVPSGGVREVRAVITRGTAVTGEHLLHTELLDSNRVIDRIDSVFTVLPPPHASASAFVRVKDGSFYAPPLAGGKRQAAGSRSGNRKSKIENRKSGHSLIPWSPYGVNYWQSNVAGTEPGEYGLGWLMPGFYDPQIVERDLAALQGLGFNTVSIQLARPQQVPQANDFIFRAARHGIRTNLFIAGAHPFETDEPLFTRLITEGRFAGNPNIWAYDIAWEHHLGNHQERTRWDVEWERWVVERYGSIKHAEKVWGYPIPRDAQGHVTNPPDDELRNDGPWLKLAAAYERCADDVISRRYGRVIGKIHALDSNHLISARSASQPSWTGWFAYDLVSTGKHFDFSSPEGYGLDPREAGFTVAYGRYAGNGKPVYWAEFGSSIYPYDSSGFSKLAPSSSPLYASEKETRQAELHRGFAAMLLESGANGLASWWSVGGYRVDEKSDFGIIAPDGTPRLSARELQRYAARVESPRPPKRPTVWVTIDRDLHAAAYQAVYENNKGAYLRAIRHGGMLGVRTAGTGTNSANCPLTAVGDLPYDGFSPLKFLNAEFNRVVVRNARGQWQEVEDGDTVEVTAGRPVQARVSVGNTGDAAWLAGSGQGAVRLIGDDRPDADSGATSRLTLALPLPHNVGRYQNVEVGPFIITSRIQQRSEVVLTLEAAGRARFGQRIHIVLKPV